MIYSYHFHNLNILVEWNNNGYQTERIESMPH